MSEQIVIVGPGRMGLALGAALRARGAVDRLIFYGRSLEPPPHPLFDPPDGAEYRILPLPVAAGSSILILAVPDNVVAEVAWDTARMGPAPPGCTALHLSGALSLDPLDPLHGAGYATGSLHPLQTVADPVHGATQLIGSAFALAGGPAAMLSARRLVNALSGLPLVIPASMRALYHAAAVIASNYLVTLTAAASEVLEEAGVRGEDSLRALLPLMRGTLDNLERLGPQAALTGPIARGDTETVRLHLSRLSGRARTLYCALGLATVQMARAAGLEERRADALESMLSTE